MKQQKYLHIKKAERLEIALLLNKNYSRRDITKTLKRSPNTISREIKENSVKGKYDPYKANHKAYVKRKYSKYQGMKIVQNSQLREYVEEKLKKDWSPEQISGRLKNIDTYICYASQRVIYKFVYGVYGKSLEKHLRYKGKGKRRKREKVTKLKNRTFIDQRPEIISKRERFGDWEGDLIVSNKSGKGVLLVLHERKNRYPIIERIMSQKTNLINQHIFKRTGGFVCFNSLTIDNDISFSKHEELSELLFRQYIPKKTDISKLTNEYIKEVERKLQNRPRKCLGYKTPLEIMIENNQFKILKDFGIIKKNKIPQVSYLRV